jgi:branched-chain amino acid transport system ATP-binding protein
MIRPPPHLEVSRLTGGYGESQVLHDVGFDIRQGETLTLLGRNGAGKTTALRAITGLLGRRGGVIRLRGRDLMPLKIHQIARAGIVDRLDADELAARKSALQNYLGL